MLAGSSEINALARTGVKASSISSCFIIWGILWKRIGCIGKSYWCVLTIMAKPKWQLISFPSTVQNWKDYNIPSLLLCPFLVFCFSFIYFPEWKATNPCSSFVAFAVPGECLFFLAIVTAIWNLVRVRFILFSIIKDGVPNMFPSLFKDALYKTRISVYPIKNDLLKLEEQSAGARRMWQRLLLH